MSFQFTYAGKNYIPVLDEQGRMSLWGVASYGQMQHKGTFMLRIYALVKAPRNEGTKMQFRSYRIVADELRVPATTSKQDQRQLMIAMMRAVEIKADLDSKLRHEFTLREPKKEKP